MNEFFTKKDSDKAYGPRYSGDQLMFGNQPLAIDGVRNLTRVGDQTFTGTPELYELIFTAKPKEVEQLHKDTYLKIMKLTGLHLNGHESVKANRCDKYT